MTTVEDNRSGAGRDRRHAVRQDGSGSFADPHMELYLDGVKLTLTPNTGGTTPNFSGDLVAGMAQSNYDGKLDQLAIWDTDKGAGDFLAALYNDGEGRIIESDEEDLILLALFNENYDDSTGTFTSPSLSGTETYDDPLVTDARGPLEPKARFIPGLAMIDAEGDVSYYLEDALGSVMALADDEEAVTGVYQYDAWGNALVEPEDDTNPYRWCGVHGYYWDANAEMYLLGLRWYDPRAGRFITPDPIGFAGEDVNLYSPMGNNAENMTDPGGLQTLTTGFDITYAEPYRISSFPLKDGGAYNIISYQYANGVTISPQGNLSSQPIGHVSCVTPPRGRLECFLSCMGTYKAQWALGALGVGAGTFGSIPLPGKGGFAGHGPWTSEFSIVTRSIGLGSWAQAVKGIPVINFVANAISVAAIGYLTGLSISCATICSADSTAY